MRELTVRVLVDGVTALDDGVVGESDGIIARFACHVGAREGRASWPGRS